MLQAFFRSQGRTFACNTVELRENFAPSPNHTSSVESDQCPVPASLLLQTTTKRLSWWTSTQGTAGEAQGQVGKVSGHLTDSSEDFLLMRVHLCEGADLSQVNILPVSKGNNLVKGKDQIKAVIRNLILFQCSAVFRDLNGIEKQSTW